MKNKNLLVFSIVLLSALLFSCSKENPVTGNQTTSTAIQSNNNGPNNSSRLAKHYGSIIGVLVPVPVKARIIAANDQYISEEAICRPDGSFELSNLAQGGYMLRVDYVPVDGNDYLSITIPKVVVIAGNVTNIGYIDLH